MQSLLSYELASAARDPLSALSALNLVSDLAKLKHVAVAGQMLAAGRRWDELMMMIGLSESPASSLPFISVNEAMPALMAEPMLKPGALAVAAELQRCALEEGPGGGEATPMEVDGGSSGASLAGGEPNALLEQVRRILLDNKSDGGPEVTERFRGEKVL